MKYMQLFVKVNGKDKCVPLSPLVNLAYELNAIIL